MAKRLFVDTNKKRARLRSFNFALNKILVKTINARICARLIAKSTKKERLTKPLLSCPIRGRTWTLLIQSQTCCQLHHRAVSVLNWRRKGRTIFYNKKIFLHFFCWALFLFFLLFSPSVFESNGAVKYQMLGCAVGVYVEIAHADKLQIVQRFESCGEFFYIAVC